MSKYEAYVHSNGSLMVKKIPPLVGSLIDKESPFVKIYLGEINAPSLNIARQYFKMKYKPGGEIKNERET